jgi:hypothetical protein
MGSIGNQRLGTAHQAIARRLPCGWQTAACRFSVNEGRLVRPPRPTCAARLRYAGPAPVSRGNSGPHEPKCPKSHRVPCGMPRASSRTWRGTHAQAPSGYPSDDPSVDRLRARNRRPGRALHGHGHEPIQPRGAARGCEHRDRDRSLVDAGRARSRDRHDEEQEPRRPARSAARHAEHRLHQHGDEPRHKLAVRGVEARGRWRQEDHHRDRAAHECRRHRHTARRTPTIRSPSWRSSSTNKATAPARCTIRRGSFTTRRPERSRSRATRTSPCV